MNHTESSSPWRLVTLTLGLVLIAAMISPLQAASLSAPALIPNDTVIVPAGNPIEIATAMFWGWDIAQDNLAAVQMAIDDFGLIKGFALQRNDYDGGCDIATGQAAANDVVANAQNVGLIGCTCSSSTSGALPILETAGVVAISHSSTATGLPPLGPTVFNRVVLDDTDFDEWGAKIQWLPTVLAWEKEFEATYGHRPDLFSWYAYDATTLLLARIDEVSTLDAGDNLLIDRAALAAAVRGTTDFYGVTDLVTLDNTTGNRVNYFGATGARHVTITGDDSGGNDCTDSNAPCASVQRGVALADGVGDVLVAGGTYTENVTIGISLTITGGFEDAGLTETIIDGSSGQATAEDWDGARVQYPMVITSTGIYKMWYTGIDLFGSGRVGYATSSDGTTWTKYGSNPVLEQGAEGEWDSYGLEAPYVLKKGPSNYTMWYSGFGPSGAGIGYATSSDGINWTKHPGNPVLTAGAETWNNTGVLHPSVVFENNLYKMWLLTIGNDGSSANIAYATSPDGLAWTWDATNPIITQDWEDWLWGPNVLHVGSTYQMWHSVWTSSDGEGHVTYASAPDETTWTEHGSPVLSGTPGEWDEGAAVNPSVVHASGTYTMYYDNNFSIGVVTSTDGIAWTPVITEPVLEPGYLGDEGQAVVTTQHQNGQVVLDGLTLTGGSTLRAGGVDAGDTNVLIRNCTIRDNVALGADDAWASGGVLGGSQMTIENTEILNNQVGAGAGGVRSAGQLTMINCLVADNHGSPGLHTNSSATVVNSTIANNDGGITFNPAPGTPLTVTNSIVYGNGWSIEPGDGSVQITYSDIGGGWTDVGNIDEDPLFADAAGGDYHLKAGSPCIDTGTPSGAPAADLEGIPRDANPDMGAYEWVRDGYYIHLPIILSASGL